MNRWGRPAKNLHGVEKDKIVGTKSSVYQRFATKKKKSQDGHRIRSVRQISHVILREDDPRLFVGRNSSISRISAIVSQR